MHAHQPRWPLNAVDPVFCVLAWNRVSLSGVLRQLVRTGDAARSTLKLLHTKTITNCRSSGTKRTASIPNLVQREEMAAKPRLAKRKVEPTAGRHGQDPGLFIQPGQFEDPCR